MKKVLMILIMLAMVFGMTGVVSAVDITYDVDKYYEASIPPGLVVHLADDEDSGFAHERVYPQYVGVKPSLLLPTDEALSVTMTSENEFFVVAKSRGITSSIQYAAGIPDSSSNNGYSKISNGAEILNISIGDGDDYTIPLKFYTTPEWKKTAKIGDTHSDTLTFEYEWVPYTWEPLWDGTADTSWYDATSTEFTLTTAEELAGFAKLVDDGNTFEGKTIKLGADIDLEAYDENGNRINFNPIGYGYDVVFKGTFNGQGHTIRNLYQNGWALGYSYSTEGGGLFASVVDATIKNVNIDNAEIVMECVDMGVVVGYSYGNCVYEDIKVTNSRIQNYNRYTGGVVGEVNGIQTFENVIVEDTKVSSLWGTPDCALGGIVGGIWGDAGLTFKDCTVNCEIDSYNDVVANYQWYNYRLAGMLIGNVDSSNTKVADPTGYVTCENVVVTYGDWINYHYCEDSSYGTPSYAGEGQYKFKRVEAGASTDGIDLTKCEHDETETHNELIVFDQLFGGDKGVKGLNRYDGVTVHYPASYTPPEA